MWIYDTANDFEELHSGQLPPADGVAIDLGDGTTVSFTAPALETDVPDGGPEHTRLARRVSLDGIAGASLANNFASAYWPADRIGAFWVTGKAMANDGLQHIDVSVGNTARYRILFQGQSP